MWKKGEYGASHSTILLCNFYKILMEYNGIVCLENVEKKYTSELTPKDPNIAVSF